MKFKQLAYYLFAWSGFLFLAFGMSGCATQSKSLALGGGIGAGAGAVLGGIADPGKDGEYRTRNVIVGSALGGMAGMVTGAVIHENTESKKQEAFQAGQKSASQPKPGAMPALSNPKVEAHWVESRVIGNRFVEGHFEYVIVEPTRWDVTE
jgi:hypothetical protein